jgi:hypothetical protein
MPAPKSEVKGRLGANDGASMCKRHLLVDELHSGEFLVM